MTNMIMILIIVLAVTTLAAAVTVTITIVKHHKIKKEDQLKREAAEIRKRYKRPEPPDLTKLTVVMLDPNDSYLKYFPYIKSLLDAGYINVQNIKVFLDQYGYPYYAMVNVTDTAVVAEQRVNGYTAVSYTDADMFIELTTENMFKN